MSESFSESYKAAGVDVTAGYKAVELMKAHVARTMTAGMMTGIGGFGGAFELDLTGITKPVLVSGTDGVGTKLKLAFMLDKHDTVGIDCVAMCVNDIICCGAKPLIFLDYIALGKNIPEKVADIVKGVADGCVETGCALVGGETAEMPGFYPVDIPRALNSRTKAVIDRSKVRVLPIFEEIQRVGEIPERDMFNTFNMGVGMIAIVSKEEADKALEVLKAAGEDAYIIGEVQAGEKNIEIL